MQFSAKDTRCAILIPVFNNTQGLKKTLLTVLNALAPNIDIIVVDDGSPVPVLSNDPSLLSKITLIRLPQNGGIIQALNAGCSYCSKQGYDYIARLDAGDTVHPDRFRKQKALLDEQKSLVLVATWVNFLDEHTGAVVRILRPPEDHEAIIKALKIQNAIVHPSVMMRMSALEKAGFYSSTYKVAEDYDLFLRLSAFGRYATIPEVLTFYEVSSAGISISRRRTQHLERLKMQLIYFQPTFWQSYVGVVRSAVALAVPKKIALMIKKIWHGTRLTFEHYTDKKVKINN